ncbi:hypothetical protein ALI144C_41225 [Actinosynnema sp. ALI-1.44]|uniref:non-ribosomal peptide synthetase n=1 Tax=Actinosynnema sp. ALI-1.44 TaxID=1933779 RepID=UPI00097C9E21|nr:non-ribosomal peptide synthetase [Actinosynnema sp. ALI-1.44]ONI75169.1 hypothetical protein ALI144C_41225 [Actinosynnema sp. ALI-1.44]
MSATPGLSDVLPLSPLQQGLMFWASYGGAAGDVYTVQKTLDLEGPVDPKTLKAAAEALLRRYPNLRAGFRLRRSGEPVALIPAEVDLPWAEIEVSDPAEVAAAVAAERAKPFDMGRPPLVRFLLVKRSDDEFTLVFTHHHILLDGWSAPLLVRELFELYAAAGSDVGMPAPARFRDHLVWVSKQDKARSLAAWNRYLDGVTEPTLVAAGHDLHARSEPGEVTTWLDEATTTAVQALARRCEVTVNTVLQAVWALVLTELTGRADVTFGLTGSGRSTGLPRAEEIIGLLINTTPVRVTVRPGESVASLLGRIQAGQSQLLAHQYLGLADIQSGRVDGELFDTFTVLENYPIDTEELDRLGERAGLRVSAVDGNDGSHYPLGVVATPGERLRLDIRHRTEIVPAELARRVADRVVALFTAMAADPDRPVGRIPVVSAEEHTDLVETRNQTATEVRGTTFGELVRPSADPAVMFEGTQLTYDELVSRANRLANYLLSRGVEAEQAIAVVLPRGIEQVVAMLATLKAGAVYVPVDVAYPAERVTLLLSDARPALVLTEAEHLDVLPGTAPVVLLSDVPDGSDAEPSVHISPDSAAYVIYTSGSTGRPKGVVVTHRGLPSLAHTVAEHFRPRPGDRVLQFASQSFDTSIWELLMALATGATVVIAPPERRLGSALQDLIAEYGVTHLTLPPSALADVDTAAVPSDAVVIVAGEACPPELARRWVDAGHRLFNSYGPTETTVDATLWQADREGTTGSALPIGTPVHNTSVYVLDGLLRVVPVGAVGELYVGGTGLARGYSGNPGLTATRFVASPFQPGARLYRTGDLVRWRTDGQLEFAGRADHQVKIRGFRVEPGEVESALLAQPGVHGALVVADEHESLGTRLVAYVVGVTAGLHDQLSRSLPEHMVPSVFVELQSFPLTPNGKIDRAALPKPASSTVAGARVEADPRLSLMCGVFAAVLEVPEVGADDSFFTLGGHSLLVTRLLSRIGAVFGATAAIRDVFEASTPRGLLRRLAKTERPALVRTDRSGPLPLSYAQRRLWFLHRLDGPSSAYNIPSVLRLSGELNVPALRRALSDVVERHESLRTVFTEEAQVVLPAGEVPFEFAETTDDELPDALRAAAEHGFDLTSEIPIRATVFKVADGDHVLLVLMHHIAGDEWSVGPLFSDLRHAYEQRRHGRSPQWTPLPVRYADYAIWQRQQLDVSAQVDYWRRQLAGAPEELVLPFDRPRPDIASDHGGYHFYELSDDVHQALVNLARDNDVTVFMVVQAAVAVLLSKMGAGQDIPLGSPIAGRGDAALEDLVGFFVNTLVLRVRTDGDPTFAELLRRVREVDLAAFEHADVPFERLVEVLSPTRSLSRNPLFQVMVTHQHDLDLDLGVGGLVSQALPFGLDKAKFDLTFSFFSTAGTLGAGIEYATDLFDAETVADLAERLTALIGAMVTRPDEPISAHSVLLRAERVPEPQAHVDGPLVPEMFRLSAVRNAGRIAIDGALSYGQLTKRVGQLARLLITRGIGPEAVVGLACRPSADLVIGLLAILETGAAYLPLDVEYPEARLRLMLDDAPPHLVLTSGEFGLWTGPTLALDDQTTLEQLADLPGGRVTDEERTSPLSPKHPAYVLFTSGSSGHPKAVTGTHGALAARLAWGQRVLPVSVQDVIVAKSSISFVDGSTELLGALLGGARVVLADSAQRQDVHALADLVVRHHGSRLTLVPSLLQALLDADPGKLECVRVWISSGEALPAALADRFRAALPAARLVDLYGCSEAGGDSLMSEGTGFARTVDGTTAYVLDNTLSPAPTGVVGELYLGGAGIARGYKSASLTATRFVAGPNGTRLYRTGDLARRDRDGVLTLLGRADDQVKVRGVRIEPAEIEAVLTSVDGVTAAAVVARGHELVAYVVADDIAAARTAARSVLPSGLVPTSFVAVPEIPLLPNGKTDRGALRDIQATAEAPAGAMAGTREEVLAQIFAGVLGLGSIGLDDNFFDNGGHSLLATRLVSRIRAVFRREVSLRTVFEAPTVRALAGHLDEQTTRPLLVPAERPALIPLSFAQRRLWFLDKLEGPSAAYTIPFTARLHGDVNIQALRAAVGDVMQRHESLRTVFVEQDGEPYQRVLPLDEIPFRARHAGPESVRECLARTFDLARDLPIRVELISDSRRDHVLVVVLHHIVADALSAGPLFGDLSRAYAARRASEVPQFEPLPVQYADYTLWQRSLDSQEQLEYWRDQLAGLPEELGIPTDRPRPAKASYRGGFVERDIPAPLHAAVRGLAGRTGTTPFMVLRTAVAVLLSKLGAGYDIPLGAPVGGRPDPALEDMVGFFVNTVVLRTDLTGDPSFDELLGRVRDTDLAAYAHQDVPFEQLVEELAPRRSRARHPLFQVMVNHQYRQLRAPELVGLTAESTAVAPDAAKFDLGFAFEELPGVDGLTVSVNYASDLFDRSTVDVMVSRLLLVIEQAVAGVRLSSVDVRLPAERPSAGAGRAVAPGTLVDRLHTNRSDAVALVHGDRQMTYDELVERSGAVAAYLAKCGVGPESVVAVAIPRSIELVVALWGVLRAGAAYVPVDPDYPAERRELIRSDSGSVLTLTAQEIRGAVGDWTDQEIHPDNAAYVIYTSGSTGRPKGAVLTHRAIVNRLEWMAAEYAITGADRILQKTPAGFDVSVWEFFLPAFTGAALVLVDPGAHRDPASISDAITRNGVTVAHFVPSMLRVFLDAGVAAPLRLLFTSGEALPADVAARCRAQLPAELHNLYGPTEAAVDVTHWHVVADGPVPIGRPVWNTQVHVLDQALRPVPAGVTGELYLGGVQLARGYLARPGLTASRFVADPFGAAGARLYRTGDLVRYRADGAIEYLGRNDDQVKLRGMRIELGEVETALLAQDGVRAAVAVVRDDRLIGYVVGETAGLLTALAERLPEQLVPSAIVPLDEIPLLPNGKVDRKALPEPRANTGDGALRDPAEELLAGMLAELLGLRSVGAEDDFFALGGHSLLAVRLVSRIRTVFGAELTISDVFDAPSVRGLAALLGREGGRPALVPAARPDPMPLSPAQQRLWFIHRMDGPSPTYNVPFTARLNGPLDLEALRAAVTDVVERHEILRTVYPDTAIPTQVVSTGQVPFDVVATNEALLPRLLAEASRHPFRLAEELPIRVTVYKLSDSEYVVLVLVHHIATDEWSARPLFTDLATAYGARLDGLAPSWPALPVQYADYALWQRQLLDSPLSQAQLDYWQDTLAGLPDELNLPADRPRPPTASYEGEEVELRLPDDVAATVRRVAAEHGVTVYMVVQAAVAVLLSKLGAGEDIPLGTPIAGRTDPALDDLTGFFVNTLVLRTSTAGNPTFAELLARVRATDLGAFGHADLPFERLVDHLSPERSMSRHPLFQVVVTHRMLDEDDLGLPGTTTSAYEPGLVVAKFDLTFTVRETVGHDDLSLALTYALDLFDPSTGSALVERLGHVLAALCADPVARLSAVDVLTDHERELVLSRWNSTAEPVPDLMLAGLFEAQVDARPDELALVDGDRRFTFAELDALANRLAQRIIERELPPESLVAIALPRSAEFLVAMFAVAKAGAAYLPVDPGHPAARVRHVLDDARPALVIAKESLPGTEAVPLLPVATAWQDGPSDRPRVTIRPDALAYVIYTSGSTGRPKGVAIPHSGLPSLVRTMAGGSESGPGRRVGQFASFSFDVSMAEMSISILCGAAMFFLPEHARAGAELGRFATANDLTHLVIPPSVVSSLPDTSVLPKDLTLIVGTEALRRDLVHAWAGGRIFLNAYGPTESTVNSTLWRAEPDWAAPVLPIGVPDVNKKAYILGPDLKPVPPGVTGELYLGGAGLARGYLGQPGLTSTRFVANPFTPGERMYRTGDLARWTPQGLIDYLGRVDEQMKVRGYRIEPAEIEAALIDLPAVKAAAVAVRESTDGRHALVGYLVSDTRLDTAAVAEAVAQVLPEYLVPAQWMQLESLPLSVAGKLNRDALPTPDFARPAESALPAEGRREEILLRLFRDLLGRDDIGVGDAFFELGGDSILSIQLVARAREEGLALTPRNVFERKTVRDLAVVATDLAGHGPDVHDPGTGSVEPTPIMRRFLTRHVAVEKFGQSMLLKLPAGIDPVRLDLALRSVLRTHDMLRARLEPGLGIVVPEEIPDCLRVIRVAPGEQPPRAEFLAARDRLDPWRGAMVQAVWFDHGAHAPSELLLLVHHLVMDGVSWRILLPDLESAYAGAELRPVRTSFRTWAAGLAQVSKQDQEPYWRSVLGDGPAPVGSRPLNSGDTIATLSRISRVMDVGELVTTVPGKLRATVNDVLLTGLAIAARSWTGHDDLLLDLEGHGRQQDLVPGADLSRTIGWFTTIYPVRLASAGIDVATAERDPARAEDVLKAVKQHLRQVPDDGIGFGLLRSLEDVATPSIAFNYLGRMSAGTATDGWQTEGGLGGTVDEHRTAEHALVIDATASADGQQVRVEWAYASGVLTEASVAEFAALWERALRAVVAAADLQGAGGYTPADVPLARLNQSQLDKIQAKWAKK